MSRDRYRPGELRALARYPCGANAGDRLRSKRDLVIGDHLGRPTGVVIPSGSAWTVVHGVTAEPHVIWLHQPDGELHTWDARAVLDDFELLASAPPVGARAILRAVPRWVDTLPEESRRLFQLCLGHPLPVAEIDVDGLVVLDASGFDARVGGSFNDIRVEAEFVDVER